MNGEVDASTGGSRSLRVASVGFRVPGQMVEVDAGELELERHDEVIVETDRGPVSGRVLSVPAAQLTDQQLPQILRQVTDDDRRIIERNRVREREAFRFCQEHIRAMDEPMKLVAVEIAHTGARATFYFSSSERVDFRALVKDLARRFHTRIEMRQIGVRDAARHCSGLGVCGRQLCCATWLPTFKPVSIRMAKDQNLSLNHDKLSGVCGRLRCCLRYEHEIYQAARKGLPRVGKRVVTPDGDGRVRDLNVLRRMARVELVDGRFREFDADDLSPPSDGRGRRERGRDSGDPRTDVSPAAPAVGRTAGGDSDRSPPNREGGARDNDRSGRDGRRRRRHRSNTRPRPAAGSVAEAAKPSGDAAAGEQRSAGEPARASDEGSPTKRKRRRRRGRRRGPRKPPGSGSGGQSPGS